MILRTWVGNTDIETLQVNVSLQRRFGCSSSLHGENCNQTIPTGILSMNKNEDKVWAVYGEDPNCDMGGHHHTPLLGYFRGTHDAVLAHAKTLRNWTTWGTGGRIEEVIIEDVDSAAHNKKQLEEIEKKISELEELKSKIKHYR